MRMSSHNSEQAARGYMMYELARRGYTVQFTDSRFPTEDLLCVSPTGKHFGIDIKGQQAKNVWLLREPVENPELFYVFIFVPPDNPARVFITTSKIAKELWQKKNEQKRASKGDSYPYDISWDAPFPYENRYDLFPK